MNLHNIEHELNKMRAETLGEAGKKLELLNDMIESEKACITRTEKICARIEDILAGRAPKNNKHNKKRLRGVLEKASGKLERRRKRLEHLKQKKEQVYKNVLMQREALGLTDHSWIDEFYMKDK